jgi:hypothetical protein
MCLVAAGCVTDQSNRQNGLKNEIDYKPTEVKSTEQYPDTPKSVMEKYIKCNEAEDAEGAVNLLSEEHIKGIADMITSNDFAKASLGLSEEDIKSNRKIAVKWLSEIMRKAREIPEAAGRKYEPPKIEILEEKIEGDKATVKIKSSQAKKTGDIQLVRENGKWKILK